MDFFKQNHSKPKPQEQPPQSLHHHLHLALNNLQTHLSGIIHRLNPILCNNDNNNNKPFCSLSSSNNLRHSNELALSSAEIKKRMAGIRAYKVSNFSGEICSCEKNEGNECIQLYYLSKADAHDFLHLVGLAGVDGDLGRDCLKVLDTPLSKVVEFRVEEPPIRLVPDMSQVKYAIEATNKKFVGSSFPGVPVFQSDGFILTDSTTGKDYRPAFLRKEDLEYARSVVLTPKEIKKDVIKVAALEDIIQEMKDGSTSKSNDILFMGPDMSSTWFYEH